MLIGPEAFLRRFPSLLAGSKAEDAQDLLTILNPLRLPAKQVLIERGDFAASMYLLLSGELLVDIEQAGRRLLIGKVSPGGWVGELALIAPGPASARVTAMEDSEMYVLGHDAFVSLRKDHPQAASAILHTLIQSMAGRLRGGSERVLRPLRPGLWTLARADQPQLGSPEDGSLEPIVTTGLV